MDEISSTPYQSRKHKKLPQRYRPHRPEPLGRPLSSTTGNNLMANPWGKETTLFLTPNAVNGRNRSQRNNHRLLEQG